jgi:TolB protein
VATATPTPVATPTPAPTPTATPTGKIAFSSQGDGPYHEIYVINVDGSDLTRLTANEAFDYGPAWSPDGQKIAFASDRDGLFDIYVMNADGSGQMRLTDPGSDQAPAWSPVG